MLSVAFSEVSDKSAKIRDNKNFMKAVLGKSDNELSLNAMIDEEIKLGVSNLNGKNNKKKLDKSKKGSWEWDYTASAICVKHMFMLTKFVAQLLDNLINQPSFTFVESC